MFSAIFLSDLVIYLSLLDRWSIIARNASPILIVTPANLTCSDVFPQCPGRRGSRRRGRAKERPELPRFNQDDAPETIGFLLLPEFPIYALIPAIEALRIANQNSGRQHFGWRTVSADGAPVRSCSGMTMTPDASIANTAMLETVIVCAGNQPTQYITKAILNWLRRLGRHGARLGAIDTGVFTLAAAGLLDGYRITLHWEAIPMFRERYPDIEVVEQLFLIDRNRLTCAGGIAALDMMLHLIASRRGYALAQVVANGFVHERMRRDGEAQRRAMDPADTTSQELLSVIRAMEDNLDQPLSPAELAEACRLSVRRLERLVRRRLDDSPMRYYLKLRLQAARNLLFYSDLPVKDVASACGFSSMAVFDRAFHAHFAQSPSAFRKAFSGERLQRFRPEVSRDIGLQG